MGLKFSEIPGDSYDKCFEINVYQDNKYWEEVKKYFEKLEKSRKIIQDNFIELQLLSGNFIFLNPKLSDCLKIWLISIYSKFPMIEIEMNQDKNPYILVNNLENLDKHEKLFYEYLKELLIEILEFDQNYKDFDSFFNEKKQNLKDKEIDNDKTNAHNKYNLSKNMKIFKKLQLYCSNEAIPNLKIVFKNFENNKKEAQEIIKTQKCPINMKNCLKYTNIEKNNKKLSKTQIKEMNRIIKKKYSKLTHLDSDDYEHMN